jgi:hypothetical protein
VGGRERESIGVFTSIHIHVGPCICGEGAREEEREREGREREEGAKEGEREIQKGRKVPAESYQEVMLHNEHNSTELDVKP